MAQALCCQRAGQPGLVSRVAPSSGRFPSLARRPAGRAWLMPSDERSLPGGDDEESLLPDGRENALPMHPEDTLLVVATMDGVVHTVEGSSGALLWSFDSGGTLLSSSSLDRLQEQAAVAAAARAAPTAVFRAHTLTAGDEESPEVPDGATPTPGTQPGTSVASAPGADDASCLEGGGAEAGAEGAAGAPKAEDELVLLPGLDGSIYVLGEGEEPQMLTEHTVQELVAAPTIFGDDGVLVGSKVRVRVRADDEP